MWLQNDFRRLTPSTDPTVDHIRFTELRLGHGGIRAGASPECIAQSLCADFRGEALGGGLGSEMNATLRGNTRAVSLSPLFVSPSSLLLSSHKEQARSVNLQTGTTHKPEEQSQAPGV